MFPCELEVINNESSIWLTAKILFSRLLLKQETLLFENRNREEAKHNIPGEQNFPRDAVGSDLNVIDASTARALDAAGGD